MYMQVLCKRQHDCLVEIGFHVARTAKLAKIESKQTDRHGGNLHVYMYIVYVLYVQCTCVHVLYVQCTCIICTVYKLYISLTRIRV